MKKTRSKAPAARSQEKASTRRPASRNQEGARGGTPSPFMGLQNKLGNGALSQLVRGGAGGGQSLPPAAQRLGALTGGDVSAARIHTDPSSNKVAEGFGSRAVTVGKDIFFNRGEFAPGTPRGDRLLTHELTHVAQHSAGQLPRPAAGEVRVARAGEPSERQARAAERRLDKPSPRAAVPPRATQPAAPEAGLLVSPFLDLHTSSRILDLGASVLASDEVIELKGSSSFRPSSLLSARIQARSLLGKTVQVSVRFGELAAGQISVLYYGGGFHTLHPQAIPLQHPGLGDDIHGYSPALLVRIHDSVVDGEVRASPNFPTIGPAGSSSFASVSNLLRWRGLDEMQAPEARGELRGGTLRISANDFSFRLANDHEGRGNFLLVNEASALVAQASMEVPGLARSLLRIERDDQNRIFGSADLNLDLMHFSGKLHAAFADGQLEIRGTASYTGEQLSGSATLLVTAPQQAWTEVRQQLGRWAPAGLGAGADPRTPALLGWGVMDFRFNEWLTGRARVVVDPHGGITSIGELRPTASIPFLSPPKSKTWKLFSAGPRSYTIAQIYGVTLGVSARARMSAIGVIGPGLLHQFHGEGIYSTRNDIPTQFEVGGTASLGAGLALTLAARGSIEARLAGVVEVASTSVDLQGTASLRGHAEAKVTLGRRKTVDGGDPSRADYFLAGQLAAAADLGVELNADLNLKLLHKRWKLLDLANHEYHLGTYGLAVDFDHTFGTETTPKFHVKRPTFSIRHFMDKVVHDRIRAEAAGEREALATLKSEQTVEGGGSPDGAAGALPAPTEGAEGSAELLAPEGDIDGGGGEGGALVPPTAPESPEESDRAVATVDFEMEGKPHLLTLFSTDPPVVLMASRPGRLTGKLQRMLHAMSTIGRVRPEERSILLQKRRSLTNLLSQTEEVERQARQLGSADVPGLRPLAEALEKFGDQYDVPDLAPYIPFFDDTGALQPGTPGRVGDQFLEVRVSEVIAEARNLGNDDAMETLLAHQEFLAEELRELSAYLRHPPGNIAPPGNLGTGLEERQRLLQRQMGEIAAEIQRLQFQISPKKRAMLPCFSRETLVHTPAGPRRIDGLRRGDEIHCLDFERGACVVGQIREVHSHRTLRFYCLRVAGQVVRATGRHPFWVQSSRTWVPAEELEVGMELRLLDGTTSPIEEILVTEGDRATYNLTVAPAANFFVGAGVLVHNGSYSLLHDYNFRDKSDPNSQSLQGPYKIYVGLNPTYPDDIYVGQTKQDRSARQRGHRSEARKKLEELPANDPQIPFWEFKRDMTLTVIVSGLLNRDQASYLEQLNLGIEIADRGVDHVHFLRVEARPKRFERLRKEIGADPVVTRAGYCQ